MPAFVGNSPYLKINGQEICGDWISIDPSFGGNTQDTTHGCSTTHVKREPGLRDYTFTVVITWPNAASQTLLGQLQPQTKVAFEYGPEGNATGKPKHVQDCIIDSLDGISQSVEKAPVTVTINLSGADVPTSDIMAGASY